MYSCFAGMHLSANTFVQYPLRLEKVVECLGSGVTVCFASIGARNGTQHLKGKCSLCSINC